jgi:hypothetical protein
LLKLWQYVFGRVYTHQPQVFKYPTPILSNMSLQIETEQEAYLAIMYAFMSVDGRVTEEETDEMIRSLMKEPVFKDAPLINLYKKVQLINQSIRFDAYKLIELAAPVIGPELKPTVFKSAVNLLQADGVVFGAERELMQHLQKCLYPQQSNDFTI